jgi:transformation/transcription domain-associated protein
MDLCLNILKSDNEDNAVICLKIIVELHKNFKSTLEGHVQPFFDAVQEMYRNMAIAVRETFDEVSVVTAYFGKMS